MAQAARDQKTIVDDAAKQGVDLTATQLSNYTKYKADLDKKLKDALDAEAKKGKTPTSPVQSQEVQEVKNNLELITTEYEGYYKKVTALGEANLVSKAATFASQRAILQAEAKAVSDSYDDQIEAITKLQGKKSNSASANVALDNQLSKAQTSKVKAEEEYNIKLGVLASREQGFNEKRTASIEAYSEALKQQVENTRIAGERAVAAVGKGDRQGQLDDNLASADRDFAKEQLKLAKQKGTMDPEEYKANMASLIAAHTEMKDVILKNDEDIRNANADWTNGFSKALQNAADEGANFAESTNRAVSGAFDSMGDALGEFVTTGKLNFRELAVSIISDMAKIAAKQAASGALSSLFGAAMTIGSAYFGGATNGFASGSAAATSSAAGASQAGYSNLSTWNAAQAKGGGWTGGTQFFAQGGAFTNSVVSSPTAFGMSGGNRGIMGEAGPEAIVPLARSSDGSLGVRMMGAGAAQAGTGGGVQVFVSIDSNGNASSSTDEPGLQQFGNELGAFVESKYKALMAKDLKDGGALNMAIKNG